MTNNINPPSNEVIFICVLVKKLQLQLLTRGFMDDKLQTDKGKVDVITFLCQMGKSTLIGHLKYLTKH